MLKISADLSKKKQSRKPTYKLVSFGQTVGVAWDNPSKWNRLKLSLHGMDGILWLQRNRNITFSYLNDDDQWVNVNRVGKWEGFDDHTIQIAIENVEIDGRTVDFIGLASLVPLANQTEVTVETGEDPRDVLQEQLQRMVKRNFS